MDVISSIQGVVSGPLMLILLFGTHVFLTIRTRVIQRYTFKGIKLSVTPDKEAEGDVSGFGALATALAATIGTGNIVGVATAIASGGPGAVFWVWLTGCFGIASKYGEAVLAIKYRVKGKDGAMIGGPMYALERGLKAKWLGILFALFAGLACFGIGNGTQGNSITGMVENTFGVSPYISGAVLTILTGVVIIGGVKSIAKVCEKLVPFMAGFYIIGCIIILFINRDFVLPALKLIVVSAFTPQAAGGGFIGSTLMLALRFGIARGLFTNEAGLGSAPIVDAAAVTRNPVRQGLIAMTGVFWDTVIVCALTGIVLVSSIMKNPEGMTGLTGGDLSSAAFGNIPVIGPIVLTVGLICFAWSTILGWSYYGERCWVYLVGQKSIMPFRIAWTIMVFVGSVVSLDLIWSIADILNMFMAFPNLIALIGLSGVIASETKKYLFNNNMEAWSDDEIPVVDK
ncbi:MAG: sodium:alanine symporter family protein [Anaerotignum sp.]|nr:sodium:alanine symporter family protein [Anaerotignum sp.]MEE0700803.1 sodium:alanine symporter family protein [Anaerotignum sp.]